MIARTNQLRAFVNQVNALLRSPRLSADDRQELIAAAQRITRAIGLA